jgi:lipoprotein-anchoring transpeptidase ErfK/SrfK
MPPRSLVSFFVSSSLAAALLLTAPTTAQAQSLIDFLWGGSKEWGGEKQLVSFNPKYTPGQIIVSFGDRRLYLITSKGHAISYPIAVPREKSRWQGTTKISAKRENPSWRPTPQMLRENPKLPSWVPGGHPMNPLGVRALYLGASAYRIHGTDAPWTIGKAVSQGCIRMNNKDVLDLYPRVPVGMRVTVTWERFSAQSVAFSDEGIPSDRDVPKGEGIMQPAFYDGGNITRKRPPRSQAVRDAETATVRNDPAAALVRAAASIELPVEKPAKPAMAEKMGDEKTTKKADAVDEPAKIKTAATAADPKPSADPKPEQPAKAPEAPATQDAKNANEATKSGAAKAAEKTGDEKTTKTADAVDEPAKIETAARTADPKPSADPKPEQPARASEAPATQGAKSAIEAAKAAAAAAAKAAEAARQAAEAAKKAAEDAKKAAQPSNNASATRAAL